MRPVSINEVFNLSADVLACVWGGLITPRLCGPEIVAKLTPYPHLVSFQSSVGVDTHLPKSNYFNICSSGERTKIVGNHACGLVAISAFESIKLHEKYSAIKAEGLVRFLGHLRNGAAHGNSFNFVDSKSKKPVDPGRIEWRGKIITSKLQGCPVFPDFFTAGDFAYLFEDITKLL